MGHTPWAATFAWTALIVAALVEPGSVTAAVSNPVAHEANMLGLHALYNATNGVHWKTKTNWFHGSPCDEHRRWYGVYCNEKGYVYWLHLKMNNLQGELPTEFSSLVQLTSTSLHDNGLYGNLSVLESMPALEYAYLHRNAFTGPLPDLSLLRKLKSITLDGNKLSGIVASDTCRTAAYKRVRPGNDDLLCEDAPPCHKVGWKLCGDAFQPGSGSGSQSGSTSSDSYTPAEDSAPGDGAGTSSLSSTSGAMEDGAVQA